MDAFGGSQLATRRAALRTTLLVVLGAVVIVGVGYGIWRAKRAFDGKEVRDAVEARTRVQLEQTIAECGFEADAEICRITAARAAAVGAKSVELCGVLEGESKDNCTWTVARELEDPEACALIENETDALMCSESLWLKKARTTKQAEYCDNIDNAGRASACRAVVKSLTQTCVSCEVIKRAIEKRDPTICSELTGESRADCEGQVDVADLDGDGLSESQEQAYGTDDAKSDSDGDGLSDPDEINLYKTNPMNPDSDADGYTDGVEVAGGYNPLGEGMIGG